MAISECVNTVFCTQTSRHNGGLQPRGIGGTQTCYFEASRFLTRNAPMRLCRAWIGSAAKCQIEPFNEGEISGSDNMKTVKTVLVNRGNDYEFYSSVPKFSANKLFSYCVILSVFLTTIFLKFNAYVRLEWLSWLYDIVDIVINNRSVMAHGMDERASRMISWLETIEA